MGNIAMDGGAGGEIQELTTSDEHQDLNDCRVYQPTTRQSSKCSQEALIFKGVDRRSPVEDFSHNACFANCVQLVVTMSDGNTYVGSGQVRRCRYLQEKKYSKYYIQTCAHNFLMFSADGETHIKAVSAKAYLRRKGQNKYDACFDLLQWAVYPPYTDDPRPGSGYDFAIASFEPQSFPGVSCSRNSYGIWENLPIQIDDRIRVSGYPGEKDGYMYTHVGTIMKIAYNKDDTDHGVLHYRVDTTGGQSGSSVLIHAPDEDDYDSFRLEIKAYMKKLFPKEHEKKTIWGVNVGVHVAYEPIGNYNIATLKTQKINKWRDSTIKSFWGGEYYREES